MSRGKVLLIVVPVAMVVGVVVTMLFLSSLSDEHDSFGNRVSLPASQSQSVNAASVAPGPVVPSVPASVPSVPNLPEESPPSSISTSASIPTPAGLTEAPTVEVNGSTVSVTFKTSREATVNSVLVSSEDGMTVSQFYDYFSRGAEYAPAVEKKATFKAGPDGVTETYELPDTSKSYWLLLNIVDNETEEWEDSISVLPIYTAGGA